MKLICGASFRAGGNVGKRTALLNRLFAVEVHAFCSADAVPRECIHEGKFARAEAPETVTDQVGIFQPWVPQASV